MLNTQILVTLLLMAVIRFKIPYWYEIPYIFKTRSTVSGEVYVLGVTDGDTFLCVKGKRRFVVRLSGIDAPEKDQPYGLASRSILSKMILGKKVRLFQTSIGRYKRTIAIVHLNDLCVNRELVRVGAAWVYNKYCPPGLFRDWSNLQEQAKSDKRGLWQFNDPIYPSTWRHRK